MVLLSYWLFPILLAITVHIQKVQNEFYKHKYFNSALLALVGSVFLLGTNISKVDYKSFEFLSDYRFYLSQIISVIFMILQFKSRKLNEHNVTICYFVNFLSLALVPFVSIGLMYLFSFQNTIEVQYKSKSDIYLLSISLFALAFFFYIDKLKNKSVNGIKVLGLAFVFGAVSGVFGSKMMQEYNPVNYMIIATLFNLLVFLTLSFLKEKREVKIITNQHNDNMEGNTNKPRARNYLFMVLGYCVTIYLNTLIISNISAEQYAIMRNVGIIIVNYAYTYHYENINLINFKDSVILGLMIAALVYFTF